MNFYTYNDDSKPNYDSWSRYVQVKGSSMDLDCTIFMNEECDVPRFRIDQFIVNGLTIEVGGGPDSYVDFPNGRPTGTVLSADVDEACNTLLGRLQQQPIKAEYPGSKWWNAPNSIDAEDEDGFKW